MSAQEMVQVRVPSQEREGEGRQAEFEVLASVQLVAILQAAGQLLAACLPVFEGGWDGQVLPA